MIDTILFDFDGVMVNSMPFHVDAWLKAGKKFEIEIDPQDVYFNEGVRCAEFATGLFERLGLANNNGQVDALVGLKKATYQKITKGELYHDARPLLSKIRNSGYKTGLVTGSSRMDIKKILKPEDFANFDVVVTGDDVKKGKPNPEGYLKAASALGVEPSNCLVVENAPLGIKAAKAAGMQVIALSTTLESGYLQEADLQVKDLAQFRHNFDDLISKMNLSETLK